MVIVVDDDSGIRDSLGALLSARGYATRFFDSAERFLEVNNIEEEAVVLMDYSLGEVSGLDAIRQARADGDRRPIIMITAHGDIELAVQAMRAGASDFMEKPWDQKALFQAIERATNNARSAAKLATDRRQAADTIASFTERETDVFKHLVRGASNKLIARALDISPRTVEFYRANVFEKANVSSVAELVRLAFMAKGAAL